MSTEIPRYNRFEQLFSSAGVYTPSLTLQVIFTAPSGKTYRVDGFWDGERTWRVRFSPDEIGMWHYVSESQDAGLHNQSGQFACVENAGMSRFDQHGPLRLSENRHYLTHVDGTPFFWLVDTAWNGPLRSTDADWEHYLTERVRQRFTGIQWVTTNWLAAPDGDIDGRMAFTDHETITINPAFFQRLDQKIDAINRAGLLAVPVLLWAAVWSSRPDINALNPGTTLPEDQAIALAKYMVARWGAHHIVWILPGDGNYLGENAQRWINIGRAVFGDKPHAPVSLHPCGMTWNMREFGAESWLDIAGYQSGHGDSDETLEWIVNGPPAQDWEHEPSRPVINLEPPYENHIAFQSRGRLGAGHVRRAMYWSLLIAPTAGISYGGHGVWGWDDGSSDPVNHPGTGMPLHWAQALLMPAAEQMAHLFEFFSSIAWWRLCPASQILAHQPGEQHVKRFIAAAASEEGDLAVIYVPQDRTVTLNAGALKTGLNAQWFDPRTGQRSPATSDEGSFTTPAPGDWLLLLS